MAVFHSNFCRKIAVLIIVIIILSILSSCFAGRDPETSAILSEMLSGAEDLPVGRMYTKKSSPGAEDYLSDDLLAALYGSGDAPDVFERVEGISLWTASGFSACEFAVFLCSSRRDTEEIADLCLGRIDIMRHFISSNSEKMSLDSSIKARLDTAKVTIIGRYVIMAVSDDAELVIKTAKAMIS